MNEHDEDDDDFDLPTDFLVDRTAISDASDFFISVLTHEFPDLDYEPLTPNDWREGWVLKIPAQFDRPVREVEALAIKIRDRIWWSKSILVPFAIEQMQQEVTNE